MGRRQTDRLATAAALALAGYAVAVIAWDVHRQPYWLGIRREFCPPREREQGRLTSDEALVLHYDLPPVSSGGFTPRPPLIGMPMSTRPRDWTSRQAQLIFTHDEIVRDAERVAALRDAERVATRRALRARRW